MLINSMSTSVGIEVTAFAEAWYQNVYHVTAPVYSGGLQPCINWQNSLFKILEHNADNCSFQALYYQ